jgi:hypothetical protein
MQAAFQHAVGIPARTYGSSTHTRGVAECAVRTQTAPQHTQTETAHRQAASQRAGCLASRKKRSGARAGSIAACTDRSNVHASSPAAHAVRTQTASHR